MKKNQIGWGAGSFALPDRCGYLLLRAGICKAIRGAGVKKKSRENPNYFFWLNFLSLPTTLRYRPEGKHQHGISGPSACCLALATSSMEKALWWRNGGTAIRYSDSIGVV